MAEPWKWEPENTGLEEKYTDLWNKSKRWVAALWEPKGPPAREPVDYRPISPITAELEGAKLGIETLPQTEFGQKLGEIWDVIGKRLYSGFANIGQLGKDYLTTTLPRAVAISQQYEPGLLLLPEEQERRQKEILQEARIAIDIKYQESQQKYQEWIKEHPELAVKPEWTRDVISTIRDKPEVAKDPAYWAYLISDSAAFSLSALAAGGVVMLATGGNPVLGAMAAGVVAIPIESQDLYNDLIRSGATPDEATAITLPVGSFIGMIEAASDLPLLGALARPVKNLLTKTLMREVGRATWKTLLARGVKTFTQVEAAEVMEEIAQDIIHNATAKIFDKNRQVFENIPDVAVRAAIATLPFGVLGAGGEIVGGITQQGEPTVPTGITPEIIPEMEVPAKVARAIVPVPREVTIKPAPEAPVVNTYVPISSLKQEEIQELGVKGLVGKFKKLDIKTLPLEYKQQVKDILDAYDIGFRTNKTISRRESLLAHIDRLEAEGMPVEIPEKYIEMASKVPLRELSFNQLQMLYDEASAAVKLGRLKNKLIKIQANRRVESAVNDLIDHIGKPPPLPEAITEASLREGRWHKVGEQAKGFISRSDRVERIFFRMDGYRETGLMQDVFYKPINEATNQKLQGIYTMMDEFRNLVRESNIDLGSIISNEEDIAGLTLTSQEKIGVYLSSLNNDNLLHMEHGNNYTDTQIKEIVNSLTAQERILADWLHSYFQRDGEAISKVRTQVEGKPLSIVDDYFPIMLRWEGKIAPEFSLQQQMAQESIYRFTAQWASSKITKRFLRERSHKAMQPVNLNAVEIFIRHLQNVEHYKAFAPAVRDLQLIVHNAQFKRAFVVKEGAETYKVIDKWLRQVAETDPLRITSSGEMLGRFLRVNATASILGVNLTVAPKQFASYFIGMAEIGELPAIKGLFTYVAHPQETGQLIKKYSPQMHQRTFEREIAEARQMRKLKSKVMNKISPKEAFMILTTTCDRITVRSLWRGAFDDFLSRNPGMMTEAAEYADRGIRRTQPIFSIKDVAEYYRSGEFMKAVTRFTNQLNQNWNFFRHELLGRYTTKQLSFPQLVLKAIESFVIPALIIGAISRSRPAKNAKELLSDFGAMALAMIPVMGTYLSGGVRGYYENAGIVTTQALREMQTIAYNIAEAEWVRALQDFPELAGYLLGVPITQPKRTLNAIIRLAQGKSDDWLELIWGQYTREKAAREDETPSSARKAARRILGR